MLRWCVAAAATIALAPTAHAYEFWLRAESIGNFYQLPDYQLAGPDVLLGRRIITETIALRIWDVGDLAQNRRIAHLPERGLRISFQTYLRIDHDFGDYTMGRILLPGGTVRDAIDVVPELEESAAQLQLLYGYLQLEGLADDRLTVQLGRVMIDDGWSSSAFDGAAARYAVPRAPIEVDLDGGLRVRASSPLGVSAYELDGTSGAGCQEYVEGPTPGTGSWQLIDRERTITNNRLTSDYEYCPQRDVDQPTVGFHVATIGSKRFGAELGYRRTWSDTVGLIGPVDRLQYPDLGLYPNDYGQAPSSGVNEERIYARVHGTFELGDATRLEPYADARYSLLDALFDRADAGLRLVHGASVLEPAVEYFYPTFDGDSIFNAFSIEPTTDVRLGYQYRGTAWRGTADAWLRHYGHDDGEPSLAGGFDAGLERVRGAWSGKLDALWDDGWGGRRVGGTATAGWRAEPGLWLRGQAIVLGVREDDHSLARDYVTSSTVLTTTYQVADFVALHGIAEADYDAIHNLQTRVVAVLDLAFAPEP
ncbi:MAG TPA: hypothetical protein VLX92_17975 [Kofleriaceae bacterium]|nr:hypothetical protein [Kofleriaceae bacterium]